MRRFKLWIKGDSVGRRDMLIRASSLRRGAALGSAAVLGAAGLDVAQAQQFLDEASPGSAARERIVVVGARLPLARQEIGGSLSVVAGDDIERKGVRYLGDALREVPGVAVNRAGSFGGATQVRLRGAEANHVLVMIDGVEATSAESGEADFSALLAGDIERVEVMRGAQSGLYGSNALAGVINIVTRRGDEGRTMRASAEVGSFDTRAMSLSGGIADTRSYLSGGYVYRVSEGFNASLQGDERDGDENSTVYLRAGSALTPIFRVDASARYVDKNSETDAFDFSGGPNQGLSIDDLSWSDTVDRGLGGSAQLALAEVRWVTILSGGVTEAELRGGEFAPTFGGDSSRTKLALQSSIAFGGSRARSTLTGFAERERETYLNTSPFDPSQQGEQGRTLDGFGAEYRLALREQLFLSAAARKDFNDRFADAESFSVGASWLIGGSGLRLHASYGSGVTNPTFFEQFGFVPGQFVGNPDLSPEKARGGDFGFEQTLFDGAAVFDVTVFQSTLEDEIVNEFPSVANDAGESDRRGVEASVAANLGGWSIAAAYTLTDAENADGSGEIRRPEHLASLDVSRRVLRDRLQLSAGVVYAGEMLDDDFRTYFTNGFAAKKSSLDAHVLARASVDYQLTDRVTLFGRVENLLDEDYQEVIGYAAPGRAVFGGLRLSWGGRV